jgi:hypothetical protein
MKQDIKSLLLQALELQEEQEQFLSEINPVSTKEVKDLTIKELETIAIEAGIDPKFVTQALAIQSMGLNITKKSTRWLGRSTTLDESLVIDRVLTREELEHINQMLSHRSPVGGSGIVNTMGLQWKSGIPDFLKSNYMGPGSLPLSVREVQISFQQQRTIIHVKQHLHQEASGIFGGLIGGLGGGVGFGVGMGVGIGALGSPVFAGLFIPLAFIGAYSLARMIFSKLYDSQKSQIIELKRVLFQFQNPSEQQSSQIGRIDTTDLSDGNQR